MVGKSDESLSLHVCELHHPVDVSVLFETYALCHSLVVKCHLRTRSLVLIRSGHTVASYLLSPRVHGHSRTRHHTTSNLHNTKHSQPRHKQPTTSTVIHMSPPSSNSNNRDPQHHRLRTPQDRMELAVRRTDLNLRHSSSSNSHRAMDIISTNTRRHSQQTRSSRWHPHLDIHKEAVSVFPDCCIRMHLHLPTSLLHTLVRVLTQSTMMRSLLHSHVSST